MMNFQMCRAKKVVQSQAKLDSTYDGYSPSFDEAIVRAPVRNEWLDEQSMLGLAWYRLTTASGREWVENVIFIVLMIGLMFFMLSL